MKSQTKAFLASVMVLALALSSIGGVTYSWFSDTEEVEMNVSIGSIDVETQLIKDGKEGTAKVIDSPPPIDPTNPREALETKLTEYYTLKIDNNDVPVIASVYVIIERFYAYDDQGNKGEVYAKYDRNGVFTGFETYDEFFSGDQDRQNNIAMYLKFGSSPSSPLLKAAWNGKTVYTEEKSVTNLTTNTTKEYTIKYFEYVCYLGDIAIGDHDSGQDLDNFKFNVTFEKGYKSYIMQKMYVRTVATQIEGGCQSYTFDSDNRSSASVNGNSTDINDVPPILFLGTDLRITIDSISLFQSGIKKVDVSYQWDDTTLNVNISFKDAEGNSKEPVCGNIRIQSENHNNPCSLVVPSHSCTISLNVGGSS